jgi:hypothetical protein
MACKQVKASLSPVIQSNNCLFSARNFSISAVASSNAARSGGMTSGETSGTSGITGKRLGSTAAELQDGLDFWAVSDLAGDELDEFVQKIARAVPRSSSGS